MANSVINFIKNDWKSQENYYQIQISKQLLQNLKLKKRGQILEDQNDDVVRHKKVLNQFHWNQNEFYNVDKYVAFSQQFASEKADQAHFKDNYFTEKSQEIAEAKRMKSKSLLSDNQTSDWHTGDLKSSNSLEEELFGEDKLSVGQAAELDNRLIGLDPGLESELEFIQKHFDPSTSSKVGGG